jgi:hypothetical protein
LDLAFAAGFAAFIFVCGVLALLLCAGLVGVIARNDGTAPGSTATWSRALYLLGFIAVQNRRQDLAERHLRKAMLLDPRDPGPWRELGRLYRTIHANQSLADLAAQHQTLLETPLPE